MDLELLEEYQWRKLVLDALWKGYERGDKNAPRTRQAFAGNLFRYLATATNQDNTPQFRERVKNLLVLLDIIKPVYTTGYVLYRGLIAKDKTADNETYRTINERQNRYGREKRARVQ